MMAVNDAVTAKANAEDTYYAELSGKVEQTVLGCWLLQL